MRGTITSSFVNLFTKEEVIPRTTRMSYGLGRGGGCKMMKHLSSMGKKTLVARAFGQMKLGNELDHESCK